MSKKYKPSKKTAKINANYKKKQTTHNEPRMLKRNITIKQAIDAFDKAFKISKQKPPYMRAYADDPSAMFMIEAYSLISEWSYYVMQDLFTRLTNLEPAPDVPGIIGQTKRLLHEVLEDKETDGSVYFAKWRMWPHIRIEVKDDVDSTRSKELTQQEKDRMSKQAVKKKVVATKAKSDSKKKAKEAKPEKSRKASGTVSPETKLRVVEKSKTPKVQERQKIKNAVKGTMTAEAIINKTECRLRTLDAMVRLGFLEVVK